MTKKYSINNGQKKTFKSNTTKRKYLSSSAH